MKAFAGALRTFFANDPNRVMFAVRLLVYVILTLIAGSALEPEVLISLLLGVIGVDALTTEEARKRTTPAATIDETANMSAYGQAGAFALELVRSAAATFAPGVSLARALAVVAPVVAPFANQSVTPAVQAQLTAKVHEALRGAGLLRQVQLSE